MAIILTCKKHFFNWSQPHLTITKKTQDILFDNAFIENAIGISFNNVALRKLLFEIIILV